MNEKEKRPSRLRFNFGFLLEAVVGTSREIELDYPTIDVLEITLSPLRGRFQATRTSRGIYIKGELATTIGAECARCLEEVMLPITIGLDDLFYYPPYKAPVGEYFVGDDGFVDLAPLVRELSLLEIPMQLFCRPDCQGLCAQCGQNLNQATCDCPQDEIDPRLAALRELLDA